MSVHCVICFVLLSGADSDSLLLLEWDGFVSYIECWTSALGSDVTLPVVKVWREGKDGGRREGKSVKECVIHVHIIYIFLV